MSVFLIAEAGVNHNGSLTLAKELIHAAKESGADGVKFQSFRADTLSVKGLEKAAYQKQTTDSKESQYDMLRRLELSREMHFQLDEECRRVGIPFLSSAFDVEDVQFLTSSFKMPFLKIPSGELTNAPLLVTAARSQIPIILSTGMSYLEEVRVALNYLAFGYKTTNSVPNDERLEMTSAQALKDGTLKTKVTLLHCLSQYPAPFAETNLRAIATMREQLGVPCGFSDHTEGFASALGAVALGATVVEKHFTVSRELPGPDHKASLEPKAFSEYVKLVREVSASLGSGEKIPQPSEMQNRDLVRRSVVAKSEIQAGDKLTMENLTSKRPGTGISPASFWNLVGKKASRRLSPDELLKESDLV